jgi:leukotriene-A4 hydrolase
MRELDEQFHLTQSGNIEITLQWLLLAIKNNYMAADQKLESILMRVGRRKIAKPLYVELAKTEQGKQRAREIFERAKSGYHPILSNEVTELLK